MCSVGEGESVRGEQREQTGGAELSHGNSKNGIKRSSVPHHVCFFPPHVFMFTCVFVAAPWRQEAVGSPGADLQCLVECQQGRVVAKCGS